MNQNRAGAAEDRDGAYLSNLLASEVAEAVSSGNSPSDQAFDRFMPERLQLVSARYWTPVRVAMRAAAWLDELNVRSVVDIGSGPGKFCLIAALASRCAFLGVEQRHELVAVARSLAKLYHLQHRVSFIEDTFGDGPPPHADAYYFYNPFVESVLDEDAWLDESVEHGEARHVRDLLAAEHWLGQAPLGTYVLTCNGIGSELPHCYDEMRADLSFACPLRLWRRTSRRR
jgi:SAM-dependent methyltransferase